jgi:hypothetical protein
MTYSMKPLGCDPIRLKGMSEAAINWPVVGRFYDGVQS